MSPSRSPAWRDARGGARLPEHHLERISDQCCLCFRRLELLDAEPEQHRVLGGDAGRDAGQAGRHAPSRARWRSCPPAAPSTDQAPRPVSKPSLSTTAPSATRRVSSRIAPGLSEGRVGHVADDEFDLLAGVGREVERHRDPATGVASKRVPDPGPSARTDRPASGSAAGWVALEQVAGSQSSGMSVVVPPLRSGSVVQLSCADGVGLDDHVVVARLRSRGELSLERRQPRQP